ncbi:MAG: hypothetical protein CR989_00965 [Flavobacteriales bacterium]|nr:MAG: hypothetical protein CR989_00965 [Flavobacteriales bacterium]
MNQTATSSYNPYALKNVLFCLFVVFCIQFTELKIDVVKVAEISLLLLTPFIYYRRINKYILALLSLFTLWLLLTLLFNPFKDFYLLQNVSPLIRPYFISLGRFLELIACVNLAALVHNYTKKLDYKAILQCIKQIFLLNMAVLLVFYTIYYLHRFGIIENTYISYWNYRLRGWYSEGGPFGLMLGFTYILTYLFQSKYNNFFRIILILTIVFTARSKAGILFIVLWFILKYYKTMYARLRRLNIFILIIGGLITAILFTKLATLYIDDIKHIKREINERPDDINLVMGRIAGVFIFPDMILDHPVFGIGLGNYPLIRNNPKYRGFIPYSPPGKADAHGFGGLMQLLVDGGFFIFSLFLLLMILLIRQLKRNHTNLEIYMYCFLLFFILGVQIYFLYPWILFGILLTLSKKPKQPYLI